MITEKLTIEQYIEYLSTSYIDFNGNTQLGKAKLNQAFEKYGIDYKLYNNYSNGYQAHFSDEYCLVLQPSDNISKNDGNISAFSYEQRLSLEVTLKIATHTSLLYTLFNFLPEVLNTLSVSFVNDPDILNDAYYNLYFNTECYLENNIKDSPNPFGTVSSVIAKQQINLSRIIKINPI